MTIRYEISAEAEEALQRLAKSANISSGQVLGASIALLEQIYEAQQGGRDLIFVGEDGIPQSRLQLTLPARRV